MASMFGTYFLRGYRRPRWAAVNDWSGKKRLNHSGRRSYRLYNLPGFRNSLSAGSRRWRQPSGGAQPNSFGAVLGLSDRRDLRRLR